MPLMTGRIKKDRYKQACRYVRGNVLDLGCGTSEILDYVKVEDYTGIDYSPEMVKKLSEKYPDYKFYARDLDEDDFGFEDKYDTITMIAVIEHLFNQKHLFKQMLNYLKKDGKIVLTTPTPFGNDVVHRFGSMLGLFSKHATEDHVVIYNKQRFKNVAKEFGLILEVYKTFQLGCNQLVVLRRK